MITSWMVNTATLSLLLKLNLPPEEPLRVPMVYAINTSNKLRNTKKNFFQTVRLILAVQGF